MRVFRFMGNEEFQAMCSGRDMIPRNYNHEGNSTTSTGFCFLPETVTLCGRNSDYLLDAPDCFEFLHGIVSDRVLVEFDAPNGYFRETKGRYIDPFDDSWMACVWMNELCCDSYNRKDLVPVRCTVPTLEKKMRWYNFS